MRYSLAAAFALLLAAPVALAQTASQPGLNKYYRLSQAAPAYKKADTLAVSQRIPVSDEVLVVGRQEGLVVVKRAGFQYYVPTRFIKGLDAPHVAMQTDPVKGTYFYAEVMPVEGATKAELYRRAKKWVAVTYRSAQDVIQLDDPEGGELITKGNASVGFNNARVRHLLTISVKDGKYRYDLRDFVLAAVGNFGDYGLEEKGYGYRNKILERHDEVVNGMIDDLKQAMNPPAGPAKGDW